MDCIGQGIPLPEPLWQLVDRYSDMLPPVTPATREMAKRVIDSARQLDETAGNSIVLRHLLDNYEKQVGGLAELRALGVSLVFGGLMRSLLHYVNLMLEPTGQNKPSLGKVAALLQEPGVAELIGQHMVGDRTMPDVNRLINFPARFEAIIRTHQHDAFRTIKIDRPAIMYAPASSILEEYPGLFWIAEQAERAVVELLLALGANPKRTSEAVIERQKDAAKLFWLDYRFGSNRKVPALDK